jgi:hypothetical protein
MEATTFQHTPDGFTLETDNTSYLIGNDDLSLLKRGYTIPLRDTERKSLGPAGVVYTRKGNTEIRIPSGDVVTIPSRLMNASDDMRRVILTPSSSGMVTS